MNEQSYIFYEGLLSLVFYYMDFFAANAAAKTPRKGIEGALQVVHADFVLCFDL